MDIKTSSLYSEYVIDGIRMSATPVMLLKDCMTGEAREKFIDRAPEGPFAPFVDESVDPGIISPKLEMSRIYEYLDRIRTSPRTGCVPANYQSSYMKSRLAEAVVGGIWTHNACELDQLSVVLHWKWNEQTMGAMASFYRCVEELSSYLFDLNVCVSDITYEKAELPAFEVELQGMWDDEAEEEQCPSDDAKSWLLYVPFETCRYRLGGSHLSVLEDFPGDAGIDISDSDYFMDCYEVVRELVEDCVAFAGCPVGRGGLMTALDSFCRGRFAVEMNLSGISSAYGETDLTKILFAEMPGAILQISDSDYDYVDSQFLLQDIAYFPLGHPDPSLSGVSVQLGGRSEVMSILNSLLSSQASEGED